VEIYITGSKGGGWKRNAHASPRQSPTRPDDLAAAKALTDGLPFLSNRDGTCAVEIFELLPM
jgi:hypothetical protein